LFVKTFLPAASSASFVGNGFFSSAAFGGIFQPPFPAFCAETATHNVASQRAPTVIPTNVRTILGILLEADAFILA
jgi:hypothetical protein